MRDTKLTSTKLFDCCDVYITLCLDRLEKEGSGYPIIVETRIYTTINGDYGRY